MSAAGVTRTVVVLIGTVAIVGSGAVTACSKEKPAETKPSTSAPNVSPTEKFD